MGNGPLLTYFHYFSRLRKERPRKRLLKKHLRKRGVKMPRLSDLQDSGIPATSYAATLQVSQVFEQVAEALAGTKKIEMKLPSSLVSTTVSHHAAGHGQQFNPSSIQPQFPQPHIMSNVAYSHAVTTMDRMQPQQSVPLTQTQVVTTTLPLPLQTQQHLPPLPLAFQKQYLPAVPVTADVETTAGIEGVKGNISIT